MTEPNSDSPPAGGSPNPSGDPPVENKGQKNADGSPKEEYTKERFDGLMSARQKDKADLTAANKKIEALEKGGGNKEEGSKVNQKEWVNYLRTEIKKAEKEESTERDNKIKEQLVELKTEYPEFTEKEILEAAIEYSEDEGDPISLKAAARILKRIKDSGKTKEELQEEERKKKEEAGGTGGRDGSPSEGGLKPYDPEKDKDKSLSELMQDGKKELGIGKK